MQTTDSGLKRVHLGLFRGAFAMLVLPGIWVLRDPNARSHPAVLTVYLGVALALLHWRKDEGGWRATPGKSLLLLLGYGTLLFGTLRVAGSLQSILSFLPFLSILSLLPFAQQGQVYIVVVLLLDLFILSSKGFFGELLTGRFIEIWSEYQHYRELAKELESRNHKKLLKKRLLGDRWKDRRGLFIAFAVTWPFSIFNAGGYVIDGGQGWAIAFTGLSAWISYLGFAQDWATERVAFDIAFDPNNATTFNKLGNVFRACKFYGEALVAYEQALRLDPNYAIAYCNKGNVLLDLKRYGEALVAYEQALRLDSSYGTVWCNKGDVLSDLGRPMEAERAYEKAERLGEIC